MTDGNMMANGQGAVRRITDNIYLLWLLLALPAVYFIALRVGLLPGRVPFVPWTGILSCWLLIVTMAITPLQMMFGPLPWLKKRRRYIGVASFGYALLHLLFWAVNANLGAIIRSFKRDEILTGWIAFAIMVLLAITSYDGAVAKLGTRWKTLQRWVYPAAILTLYHWVTTTDHLVDVAIYCVPLVLLEIWRVMRNRNRARRV